METLQYIMHKDAIKRIVICDTLGLVLSDLLWGKKSSALVKIYYTNTINLLTKLIFSPSPTPWDD